MWTFFILWLLSLLIWLITGSEAMAIVFFIVWIIWRLFVSKSEK
ncbi:hypothetical protein [Solibacillus sp. CAU 1738]